MELLNKKFSFVYLLLVCTFYVVNAQEKERRNEFVDAKKYLPTLTFQEGGFMKTSAILGLGSQD
jgi:hypothetical protein